MRPGGRLVRRTYSGQLLYQAFAEACRELYSEDGPSRRPRKFSIICPLRCRSLPIRLLALIWWSRRLRCGIGVGIEIRRIEIIFSGNSDEREQRIPPRIGEGGSHALRRGDIGDPAHGPFRGNPFAGRMRKNGGEAKETAFLINLCRLNCRDFMPAKALADDIQAARQRGIAEGAVCFAREGGPDGANERFLWIGQLAWALARAAEMLPIASLERCMASALRAQDIKAHGA